jgi:hypothetical protein
VLKIGGQRQSSVELLVYICHDSWVVIRAGGITSIANKVSIAKGVPKVLIPAGQALLVGILKSLGTRSIRTDLASQNAVDTASNVWSD